VGSTTGFTGLMVPPAGSNTPWKVGRGQWAGAPADYFRGSVDELRFSWTALPPNQFLVSTDAGPVNPPVITQQPAHQTLRVGMSSSLSVTATGTGFAYQWYRNDQAIGGATNQTLPLNNVTVADDGLYTVRVINEAAGGISTTSAPAVVRVLSVSTTTRSLGLNFVGSGSGNWSNIPGIIAPEVSAGFVPGIGWNNSGPGVGTQSSPVTLLEKSGATPSYIQGTWASGNTWALRVETGNPDTAKGPDMRLLHGYVESRAATGATVSITNIPYVSYDVYVYVVGGNANTVGSVSLNREGTPTYFYRLQQNDATIPSPAHTAENPFFRHFVIAESTTRAVALTAPQANFARFTGITGDQLTVSVIDSVLNSNSGGIAAVQVVDTSPPGAAYPPSVTSAPASLIRTGGSSATFSATAVSNNGGTISYKWQKDGLDLPGQTSSTLALSNLTGAATGTYTVVATDSVGLASTTRSATLIVVDDSRSLMINGDLNTAGSPTFAGHAILRTDGSQSAAELASGTTAWNGILGGAGAATRTLARESTGLALPGVSFSYSGAEGIEDNTTQGFISTAATLPLIRDYLYTDNQSVPLTGTISGLGALAGKRATLLVYAYGKLSMALFEATTSDTATVTLAAANNYLGLPPKATTTSDFAGRNLDDNNLEVTLGDSAAYVSFDVVVGPGGTVSWSLGPDADGGRIPLVGFQLLVTNEDVAPPVPTNLSATAGAGQVSLEWTASAGATSYTILRGATSGGPYEVISAGVVTGTSYVDSSVASGATYYYVVAAVNLLAQSANSNEASATTGSANTPVENWRLTYFGSTANSGNAGDLADPDGDGIPNLLEYALGTNPTAAGTLPVALGEAGGALTLTFTPVVDSRLSYAIEASNDLASGWTVAQSYGAFAAATPVTYTDTAGSGSNPRRFLRLKVTLTE
jgi:hypothetical protein